MILSIKKYFKDAKSIENSWTTFSFAFVCFNCGKICRREESVFVGLKDYDVAIGDFIRWYKRSKCRFEHCCLCDGTMRCILCKIKREKGEGSDDSIL